MIEITRQMTGMAKKVNSIADTVDLLEWARENEGFSCTVVARVDGDYHVELGGTNTDSVICEMGNWVIFDSGQFLVLTQEEFEQKGYATQ